MDAIQLMALPFAECLVLVGIHSYLGIHVIKRKVIFVDLALAQIAALGTTVAFLFGINPHSTGAYWFSLAFTFLGAAVFSLTRIRSGKIPQEAVIGLVYALASAVAILVIDRAPHGAEHIKEILTGSILWVKGETVLKAAAVYLFVGVFHYIFRKKFVLISNNPLLAYEQGISVRFWDFLFYISFGLVITHSVQTAGVLLVFVFLVAPAILAVIITDKLFYQLIIGWSLGTLVSVIGLTVSYIGDFPSGPAVVAFYGATLLAAALIVHLVYAKKKGTALLHIGAGVLAVVAITFVFYEMGIYFSKHPELSGGNGEHETHTRNAELKAEEVNTGGASKDKRIKNLCAELDDLDIMEKKKYLSKITDESVILIAADSTNDEEKKLVMLQRLYEMSPDKHARRLLLFLENSNTPMFRDEALTTLKEKTGEDFGFDPWDSPTTPENIKAIQKFYEKMPKHSGSHTELKK